MERVPFPMVIDNSQREAFVRCPFSWALRYLHNWRPKNESIHLRAGGAFATGVEQARRAFYVDGKSEEDAIALGWKALVEAWRDSETEEEHVKDLNSMTAALVYYFRRVPMSTDYIKPAVFGGIPMIEFSAVHPLPVNGPDGTPVLYYGRHDMVGQHIYSGTLYGVDEKTSTTLGARWISNWDMDAQFTGYCWLDQQSGLAVNQFLIRGVSITSLGNNEFAESLQTRSNWRIEQWLEQIVIDVENMKQQWERNKFSKSLGPGCKMYGGCIYKDACKSRNPLAILRQDFVQQRYAPWEKSNG